MPNNPNIPHSPNRPSTRKSRAGRISASKLIERLTDRALSLESRIDATQGPFIELGAVPSSPREKSIIDLRRIKKPLLTSNIYQPQTLETGYRHRITGNFKIVTHRDEAPRSRLFKSTGQNLKVVGSGENWADPVLDEIDFIADARRLPFDNGSVGALYAIGLYPDAELKLIQEEAPRVLEPAGVLVLDYAKEEFVELSNPYLEVLKIDKIGGGAAMYAAVRNDLPFQPPQ